MTRRRAPLDLMFVALIAPPVLFGLGLLLLGRGRFVLIDLPPLPGRPW